MGGDVEPPPDGAPVPSDEDEAWRREHPCALSRFDAAVSGARAGGKKVCVFLDYDGTLAPIVRDPDRAFISEATREAVRRVSRAFPTAIITGRAVEKVRAFVQLDHLLYAGSHGLDIQGPSEADCGAVGARHVALRHQPGLAHEDAMRRVRLALAERTVPIDGAHVEDNKFCCSVHFRNVRHRADEDPSCAGPCAAECAVRDAVRDVLNDLDPEGARYAVREGKKVLEVRPSLPWHKGDALEYLLCAIHDAAACQGSRGHARAASADPEVGEDRSREPSSPVPASPGEGAEEEGEGERGMRLHDAYAALFPVYLGDDVTDEDAFGRLAVGGGGGGGRGLGVVVSGGALSRATDAGYSLRDPLEVTAFLDRLAQWGRDSGAAWWT